MDKESIRQCQPCTCCCDGWLQIVIDGVDVCPGRPCPHSTGAGCDDYENRPVDPCRSFSCGWIAMNSPLPNWMKPDQAKVILLLNKFHWHGLPVDLAVPVGKQISPRALDWLKHFSVTNKRPLIFIEHVVVSGSFQPQPKVFGHGPLAFQQELLGWQEARQRLW